jgi:hypothetical protein
MGLGFLVPAFLAGLAALAVPIILHLRHRERERPHRFPSLMFLRRIPIRTARRRRITDWLLLSLRALALTLLIAAFARPFFAKQETVVAIRQARSLVVLLDRSLSMGHRAVWSAALDSARVAVNAAAPGDRVAVVLFDEEAEVVQPFTADRSAALAALAAARPVARGTRYAAALRAARQVLLGARGRAGEAVVVTDMQRSGLAGAAGLELPADITVRTVVVQPKERPDAALIGADLQRIPDGERHRLVVSARVTTRGLAAPRATRLSLTVNGRPAATRDVTLPRDGLTTVAFDPVPIPAGIARAEVTFPDDDLSANDTLHAMVPPEDRARIILAAAGGLAPEETLYLERALGIGREPRFAVERRSPAGLDAATLRGASVVLLYDAPPTAAIESWVHQGGGLVVAAGKRLGARRGPVSGLPTVARGEVERIEDRGGVLGEVSLDHPIFAAFRATSASLGTARFLSYPKLDAVAGASVVARFDDGSPALIEQAAGAGRVVVVATPLDAATGDFPLQPAYLPFLRQLMLYAARYEPAPVWRTTGESAAVPAALKDPVIATPSGALLRPGTDSAARALTLNESGYYQMYEGRAAGEPALVLAVNPPPAESDLTPADPRELMLGVRRGDSSLALNAPPPSREEREGRQRVWRLLLLAAAGLLLIESLVANRGWRAVSSPVLPAPASPERSPT